MGWVDSLRGKVIGIDTAPLIYYIEEHPTYLETLDPFFDSIARGEIFAVTSILSLLETLVIPIRKSDALLTQKYHEILLDTEGLLTVELSQVVAEEAAKLRAFHSIHTPDSIQMATAIIENASFFLTNDKGLPSLPNLKILVVDELLSEGG
jgi:predicted nucleic acid-binding protein